MESSAQGLSPVLEDEVKWSDNEACLDAPFTYAVSKSTSNETSTSNEPEAPEVAGCGTIGSPPSGGAGPSIGMMTLGFLLSLMASSLMKRKKFLS
jgi:hypothetical protein